jgi:gliding motility-associated-like protein
MSIFTFINRCMIVLCLLLFTSITANAQRIYADDQANGRSALLCLGCTVTNPTNAVDGNLQSYSVINAAVGLVASTYQEVIFTGSKKPAINTPIKIKMGTGNNLADLTVLGAVTIRAYNGGSPAGPSYTLPTLLTALSNNNQFEASITPNQNFDRIRITLQGGLIALLSNLYVYDAYYNGNGPIACSAAVDELHGISSALLNLGLDIGGVVNPRQAIDGDINTASTLNAGVGLLGAYAQQTILYNTPSVIGDSVRLTLSLPQALLDAGVLTRISLHSYLGNFDNDDDVNLSSALLSVRLLDLAAGRRKVTVTYAPTKVFDRVQLRLGGGIANVLSTLNLYEAQKLIPRPIIKFNNVVANNVQTCAGSTVTLTATAVPNTTFSWYTTATGGSAIATGNSYTTGVLNANTTLYVAAARTGCTDQSERTPVIITVNQIPAAPVITDANAIVCPGGQATFVAQSIAGVTVNWYTTATGGTPVFSGNTFTTEAITQNTTFYAEAVAGGTCLSTTRTPVTATLSPLPANPALTNAAVTICSGEVATLSVASPAAGLIYRWYSTATGGTPIYTGVNFTTPALTANINYYVEAENAAGCTSGQRALATVTVLAKPANPVLAANDLTINAGQTATITVTNSQTGITYNWYTSAGAATPVHTGNNYTTPALFTNTTYYVAAVNAGGCQSANRTAITINVAIDNNSPCVFANDQVARVNGICIGCGVTNNALATDADTTTSSTIHVFAGLLGGYAEQELRFQQPGFAGDTVRIIVQTPVGLADVGVLGQIEVALYNNTTQVVRYGLDNALIKIRLLGGGNRYAISIPANGNYDRATIRLNSGVASLLTNLQVFYAIQQYPAPVFNPLAPEICKGSTALINITSPGANLVYNWYTTPTGGASVHTGANYTTAALNGNTTYYVEVSRAGCAGSVRYPVQVLVNDPPVKPVVTPTNAAIFSGQKATFTAAVANNVTVKWYEAASGGTAVATGSTFITPTLNANKIYYAESSIGTCVNPDRTPVTVTVTQIVIPNVAVNPPTQTVNPGTSATLTASSTTPGTIFNWYTTPTGGTSIHTGAVFNTPAVFANTTYYAEAVVQASGAKSATRASGVVNVNQSAVNPVPCDAAIDQTEEISGLCLLCSISNNNGSVDADRNTFSRISVPVGLLGAYAGQTLRFANIGRSGDSVIVELGIPGSLADVTLLSAIQLATYNGANYNNDRFNVNGSLLTIRLLNGTSRFRVAFKAGSDFDRVEIRLNSVASVLNALNIYDASQVVTAPVIAIANTAICAGTQATLTAAVPDHVTVRWYTTPTGGTPVFTGNVFNTPQLNTNTIYYAEASRTASSCAQSVRTPANVTITPVPAAPVVSIPVVTVCSGSPATFAATPVAGVTYNWYTSANSTTPIFTGNTFTTGNLNGTTSYFVEAAAGQCASSARTQVTANVTTTPLVPTVSQTPVETCSGSSAVLSATSTQPGVTFRWYTAATGGSPVFTGAQFTTPNLTADRSYYVEAVAGTCVSATRAKADVNVNPTPANPVVTVNPTGGQITSGQTATLNATSSTAGASFRWYNTPAGGTPIHTGASFTTPQLTSTTTYYVEARIATSGCISVQRTAVTVTVNPIFSTDCDFASNQISTVVGGVACIGCQVANPSDAVDSDTTNFSTLHLPISLLGSSVSQRLNFDDAGTVGDTVTLKLRLPVSLLNAGVLNGISIASYNGTTQNADRIFLSSSLIRLELLAGNRTGLIKFAPKAGFTGVEITLNEGVVSLFTSLDVFYATKQVEAPQLAATVANICSGTGATFTVSNVRAGVVYRWYNTATGGSPIFTGTSYATGNLTASKTVYVESARAGSLCANPNRVAATANVTPAPVNPVLAENAVEICAGESVILRVTNAGGATVRWYNAATNGTLLFTGPNFTVTPVSNAMYYAELSNGSCTSPARTVATITVNPRPSMPGVVSANVQVCTGSPATLQVLNPEAGVTYRWYAAATGGAAVFTGATFVTGNISANTSYYVEASNTTTGCTNNGGRRKVDISITAPPAAPTLSATQSSICSGGTVSLSVNNPVAGTTYNWYTTAAGTTPVFTGTTYTINNITTNASYFVEAVNASSCASSSRTQTTITVLPVPGVPQIQLTGGGNSVCLGSQARLRIVNPDANLVYRWYSAATNGTLLFTGTVYNTPALTANRTFYVEAANAGNCTSSARASITINITPLPPDPVLTANNVTVCLGSTATLAVSAPQAGIIYRWYSSPAQTAVLFEGPLYTTGPITANTTYYVSATNASGCTSDNLTSAQVTVQSAPPAPVIANGNTVQTCTGSNVTLIIDDPEATETYRWYTTATGGNPVFTGTSFTINNVQGNVTYYAEARSNNGGCNSSARTQVTINVNPVPATPVVTAQGGSTTPSVCANSSAVLTATSTTPNVTFRWYTAANGGAVIHTGATYTTPNLSANTTYYVEALSNAGGCTSSARGSITITITQPPATPVASDAVVEVCTGNRATLDISLPGNFTYNWYTDATRTNKVFTGIRYVTGPLTTNATFYAEAVSGSCASTGLATFQVNVSAPPAAPAVVSTTVPTCDGGRADMQIANPQPNMGYRWYSSATGGAVLFTGTFYNPIVTSNVTYYVEAFNNGGCVSTSRTAVNVTIIPSPPAPQLTAADVDICPNNTATLTATATVGITVKWYLTATGGGVLGTGNSFTTPVLGFTASFYAEATRDNGGCVSETRTKVTVHVLPPLDQPIITAGDVTLSSVTFVWNAVNGAKGYELSTDNGQTFSDIGTAVSYTVNNLSPNTAVTIIVRAYGDLPCELSANSNTATLTSKQGDAIFVPNAFTPNGDGNNDQLMVYGSGITALNLYIYDQWGELVFKSSNQANGWDGTYKSNRMPVGVYVYYLEATMSDGKKVNKKGTITLLR